MTYSGRALFKCPWQWLLCIWLCLYSLIPDSTCCPTWRECSNWQLCGDREIWLRKFFNSENFPDIRYLICYILRTKFFLQRNTVTVFLIQEVCCCPQYHPRRSLQQIEKWKKPSVLHLVGNVGHSGSVVLTVRAKIGKYACHHSVTAPAYQVLKLHKLEKLLYRGIQWVSVRLRTVAKWTVGM